MLKLPTELQSIRGMNDILPSNSVIWMNLENLFCQLSQRYGFNLIRTPIVEPTSLFSRTIGKATEIVEKEMYSFNDKLNDQALTLRPENTASCIRAYFQGGFSRSGIQKWFYLGPMFRHERPQRGRYRQFYQFGLEIIGSNSLQADLELIIFSNHLWKILAIPTPMLEINSLGHPTERQKYNQVLTEYWLDHKNLLDQSTIERIPKNPLRLLDSKNPDLKNLISNAPSLFEYLGEESKNNFNQITSTLQQLNIDYIVNTRLVRGLDYYNQIVFEWVTDKLGAQASIGGGGRYDGLAKILVGEDLPACGLAIGIERIVELLPKSHSALDKKYPKIYIAHEGGECLNNALTIANQARSIEYLITNLNYQGGKISNQLKKAIEYDFTAIIGTNEQLSKSVTIKNMKNHQQATVKIDDFKEYLQKILNNSRELR